MTVQSRVLELARKAFRAAQHSTAAFDAAGPDARAASQKLLAAV